MKQIIILIIALFYCADAHSSFDIDTKELDAAKTRKSEEVKPPRESIKKRASHEKIQVPEKTGRVAYTVRQGDHIFRILIERFGYSNSEAEKLIPSVKAENGISDIKRLKVGMRLLIPIRSNHALTIAKHKTTTAEKTNKPDTLTAETSPIENIEVIKEKPSNNETAINQKVEIIKEITQEPEINSTTLKDKPIGNLIAIQIESPDQGAIFASIAETISLSVEQNRIVTSNRETSGSFSIKVPLYAEGGNKKIIVAGSSSDPFQYTLYRILESDGYSVIRFSESDQFREIAEKLLKAAGIPSEYRKYRLEGEGAKEAEGFIVSAQAGRLLLTQAPVSGIWSAFEQQHTE